MDAHKGNETSIDSCAKHAEKVFVGVISVALGIMMGDNCLDRKATCRATVGLLKESVFSTVGF